MCIRDRNNEIGVVTSGTQAPSPVSYTHLDVYKRQVYEVFAIANIVGGTIVIPHTRRGAEYWEALIAEDKSHIL